MTAKQARRLDPDDERRIDPSVFGAHICVDHIVLNNVNSIGMNGERAALFIMDMHTRFTDLVPVANKWAEEALKALRSTSGTHRPRASTPTIRRSSQWRSRRWT